MDRVLKEARRASDTDTGLTAVKESRKKQGNYSTSNHLLMPPYPQTYNITSGA